MASSSSKAPLEERAAALPKMSLHELTLRFGENKPAEDYAIDIVYRRDRRLLASTRMTAYGGRLLWPLFLHTIFNEYLLIICE
jgi:hypothetical protein